MKLNMKRTTKKVIVALLVLLIISLGTAITTNELPENATYDENKEYFFSINNLSNLEEIDNVTFNLNNEKTNITKFFDESPYEAIIKNLGAGKYFYEWIIEKNSSVNKTNGTYTINKKPTNLEFKTNLENESLVFVDYPVSINISSNNKESEMVLYLNDEQIKKSKKNFTLNKLFNETGKYTFLLKQEETQNYTSANVSKEIEVVDKLSLKLDKEEYNLGEKIHLLVNSPIEQKIKLDLCKNDLINPEYVICYKLKSVNINEETANLIKNDKTWKRIILNETKNPGTHTIIAKKDSEEIRKISYEVLDTLKLEYSGKTEIEVGEETTLKATASGGHAPYEYTWELTDGSTKKEREIDLKYSSEGDRTINLIVEDYHGNRKNKTIDLAIKKYHDLTIEVKNQRNQALDALVNVRDVRRSKETDNSGKATFNLPSGEYEVLISSEGYESKRLVIELKTEKSKTVRLDEEEIIKQIEPLSPLSEETIETEKVRFEAKINLAREEECKILLSENNNAWFEEIKTKRIREGTITAEKELEDNKYTWRVLCERDESEEIDFEVNTKVVTTSSINAGEIRQQLENAIDNMVSAGLNEKKAIEILDIENEIQRAIRDYDRIIRDINSLAVRRDLSDSQKQSRLQDYQLDIEKIQDYTPEEIEVINSEEFVSYPSEEALVEIVEDYVSEKNIQANKDLNAIKNLQNDLLVRTYAFQIRITTISGLEKEKTIVQKSIEYKKDFEREHFLLEQIPISFENSLVALESREIVKRNNLIKFDTQDSITYYIEQYIDLDDIKKTNTVLLNNNVLRSSQSGSGLNLITGRAVAVTDIDSTTGLIIILIVLLLSYLAYLFDLKSKIQDYVTGFSKDKKIKELTLMLNDSKDHIEAENLERANLIYKEIKLTYNKSPKAIKAHIYKEAEDLINLLNEKYLEHLLKLVHKKIEMKNKKEAIKSYNKLTDVYNNIDEQTQKTFKEQMLKLRSQIEKL